MIPGSGRSLGEINDNSLQYSCLENPIDRGVWQATVHGVARVGYDLAMKPQQNPLNYLVCPVLNSSVISDSLWPHRLQFGRLLCPWNFPGKNTGMGCHFLLQEIFLSLGLNPHLSVSCIDGQIFTTNGTWCELFYKSPSLSTDASLSQAGPVIISHSTRLEVGPCMCQSCSVFSVTHQ